MLMRAICKVMRRLREEAFPMAMRWFMREKGEISMVMKRLMGEEGAISMVMLTVSSSKMVGNRGVIGVASVIHGRTLSQVLMMIVRQQGRTIRSHSFIHVSPERKLKRERQQGGTIWCHSCVS
jgi:hypothetical protein